MDSYAAEMLYRTLEKLVGIENEIAGRLDKGAIIRFGDELCASRAVLISSLPEILSRDELCDYHRILASKKLNPMYLELEGLATDRVEEAKHTGEILLEDLRDEYEKKIADIKGKYEKSISRLRKARYRKRSPVLNEWKNRTLGVLKTICTPDAYARLEAAVEMVYAERE